jgi:hypothetical protein
VGVGNQFAKIKQTATSFEFIPSSGNLQIGGTLTSNNLITGTQVNKATITYTTDIARTLTIPPLGGNRTFAFINQAQTFSGDQTFANNISVSGNVTVSSGNATGGGIILADDGDIVDLNDSFCSMRFSGGVRVFSANRGGSAVITLANSGDITASGTVTANSDIRLKDNISTIENALEKTLQLRGVEFDRIDSSEHQMGVIAQEIEEVIPFLVREDCEGIKSVAYSNMVGLLIEAIKELNQKIDKIEN